MIPSFLVDRFGAAGARVVFWGGIVALAALILLVSYCSGRHDGKTGEVVKEQGRTIEFQQQTGAANEKASGQRVQDAQKLDEQKEELNDAVRNATSGDDARRRSGCAIMRQQGRDTSGIPECAGS